MGKVRSETFYLYRFSTFNRQSSYWSGGCEGGCGWGGEG